MPGKFFVISAPSGAGKTTLVNAVVAALGTTHGLERAITYTTKIRAATEREGVDYHFISNNDFQAKIAEGFFIEWSTAYGNYYGSPRHILDAVAQGTSFMAILDRAGAARVKECYPEAVLIWIYTKDLQVLAARLATRCRDNKEAIARRLALAVLELEAEKGAPLYQYHLLNDDLAGAISGLEGIIVGQLGHGGVVFNTRNAAKHSKTYTFALENDHELGCVKFD